jgi:hypothetical protein
MNTTRYLDNTQSENFQEGNSDILKLSIATQTWLAALRWPVNSPINEANLMAEAIVTMRVSIIWVASARTDGKFRTSVHLAHFAQTLRLSGMN